MIAADALGRAGKISQKEPPIRRALATNWGPTQGVTLNIRQKDRTQRIVSLFFPAGCTWGANGCGDHIRSTLPSYSSRTLPCLPTEGFNQISSRWGSGRKWLDIGPSESEELSTPSRVLLRDLTEIRKRCRFQSVIDLWLDADEGLP